MEQERIEWLKARQSGIGGSDAAAILGLNPYKTAYSVWKSKVSQEPIVTEDNEKMRQGRDFEQYVASRFTEATGLEVRRNNNIIRNEKYPFALANIDRKITGQDAGLECKTTGILNLKRYKNGEFPAEYYCQCVHYMAVTGYSKWYLAVLVLNHGFMWYEIERDEEEINILMEKERQFWNEYVLTKTPPPADIYPMSEDDFKEAYPTAYKDKSIDLINREPLIAEYMALKANIKTQNERMEEIEGIIKADMQDAEYGVTDAYKVSWKNGTRKSLDSKMLIAEHSEIDFTPYYKQSNYRTFSVKEITGGK